MLLSGLLRLQPGNWPGALSRTRKGRGLEPTITPRPDGLITRDQAAQLCGVTPEAITNWTRGYGPKHDRRVLPVAGHVGRVPLFDPVEVAKAEHATALRARRRADA